MALAVAEGEKHDISKRTIQKARATVHGRKAAARKHRTLPVIDVAPVTVTTVTTAAPPAPWSHLLENVVTALKTAFTACPESERAALLKAVRVATYNLQDGEKSVP
jgi:hypothetical protein